jgi:N-acetylglucosamine kinase-like BadF-type ATPase
MSSESNTLSVCIGVDGGGTRTRAQCIRSSSGDNVGTLALGSCSNMNSVGQENAKLALCTTVESALRSCIEENPNLRVHVDAVCLSVSGVDRPRDSELVRSWIRQHLHPISLLNETENIVDHSSSSSVLIYNDAVAALASGTQGRLHGLVVISGTGMICFCYRDDGCDEGPWRVGGWGPLLGDRGSGFSIGQRVLEAVCEHVDGRGDKTMLRDALIERLGIDSDDDIIAWTYADVEWARFAALSTVAFEVAARGDDVAKRLIDDEAAHLYRATRVAALRSGIADTDEPFCVVLSGGNLTHDGSLLAAALRRQLDADDLFARATVTLPSMSAERAAALLARNSIRTLNN